LIDWGIERFEDQGFKIRDEGFDFVADRGRNAKHPAKVLTLSVRIRPRSTAAGC
jgi:hypothetical protein